jgi:hypothetical protein
VLAAMGPVHAKEYLSKVARCGGPAGDRVSSDFIVDFRRNGG